MKQLAELDVPDLVAGLTPAGRPGTGPGSSEQEARIGDPASHLDRLRARTRPSALAAARQAADRIEAGIGILLGRTRPRWPRSGSPTRPCTCSGCTPWPPRPAAGTTRLSLDDALAAVDEPKNHSWRPFQLAFLLLNLPALADPTHPDRADGSTALADLLWFPTGGGKTEAYLGLTAFVLAIRRLQATVGGLDARDGVAVLMRYTLRLLTIQQFQRAAALICACETIRRADTGSVGAGAVPHRAVGRGAGDAQPHRRCRRLAQAAARRPKRAPTRALGSPHQLVSCPWCGSGLEPGRDITVDTGHPADAGHLPGPVLRVRRRVPDGEGLPVVVVDEEIYRLLPSLIIGTVDKFAQLTWRGETQALFGRVSRRCTRHGYVTADTMAEKWELSSDTSVHPAKGSEPAGRIEKVGPAAAAGPDHPGRAAPDLRPAGLDGRAV